MARKHGNAPELKKLLRALLSQPPGNLAPPLEGYAYRFTLFLPLLSEGKKVFTDEQTSDLGELFNRRFAGYTATTAEGAPPWYGSWLPAGTARPIIDKHMLFVVYSPQVEEAKTFFGYLKSVLQRKDVANQEVVLIEHTTVWLVKALEPPPGP